MEIRSATDADVPAIASIYNHAVLNTTASFDIEPKTIDDRREWLAAHGGKHPVLVAVDGNEIVGWGSLSQFSQRPAYDATVEISVYVDANHHKQGIGRALTIALLEAGRRENLHSVLARICTENEASIAMVRSLGFVEAGTIHEAGCKFGRWLDVVTWEYLFDNGGCES